MTNSQGTAKNEHKSWVTVMPGRRFGNPCVRGVNEVDWLVDRYWAGDSIEDVAMDYNATKEDVLIACWYIGEHSRSRAKRDRAMRKWARNDNVFQHLWRADYEKVPPPPTKETADA